MMLESPVSEHSRQTNVKLLSKNSNLCDTQSTNLTDGRRDDIPQRYCALRSIAR